MYHHDIFGIRGLTDVSQWIFDSGATSSCTGDLSQFSKLSYDVPFTRIRVANGKYAHVKGIGDVTLHMVDTSNNTTAQLVLRNVL